MSKYDIGEVFKQKKQDLLNGAPSPGAVPATEAVKDAPVDQGKTSANEPVQQGTIAKKTKPKSSKKSSKIVKASSPPLKRGRKKLNDKVLLSKKITVNFTEAEFESLQKFSEEHFGVPVPKLIRRLLQQQKVI